LANIFEYKNSTDEEKTTPQEFVPKKKTAAKKLAGVRKKAKDKVI